MLSIDKNELQVFMKEIQTQGILGHKATGLGASLPLPPPLFDCEIQDTVAKQITNITTWPYCDIFLVGSL